MAWEWLTTSVKGYTFGYSPTFDLNSSYIRTPLSDYIPGNSPLAMYNENGLPEIERNLDVANDGYLTFKLSYDGSGTFYFEMDGTYYDIALPYKSTFSNTVDGMTVLNVGIGIDEVNKWAAPVILYTDTAYDNQYVYLVTVFLSATSFLPPGTPYENTAQARGKDLYNAIKLLQQPVTKYSNGGGATHVARANGQLKDLSSNLRNVIMIAAGGGGGMFYNNTIYEGADAGGIQGNKDNSATQSTGYAFGEGESAANLSAGGSGLYGGYKGVIPGPVIPVELQELLDMINGANFTEKYYMTDNWITSLSNISATDSRIYFDGAFKDYTFVIYTNISSGYNVRYITDVSNDWNRNDYSDNHYVAGKSTYSFTGPTTGTIFALAKTTINITKNSNDSYTFTIDNITPLNKYNYYGTMYYTFRIKYDPNNENWQSWSVSYTDLDFTYQNSLTYTGTLENCLKVIAMNFRNVNIYVDGVLWSSAVS